MDENLPLAEPRHFLKDTNHLLQLFEFPADVFERQASSLPALVGSDILLHYFRNAEQSVVTFGTSRSAFTLDMSSLIVPEPDSGKSILPPKISSMMAQAIYSQSASAANQSHNAQMFLYGVLDLMPSLNREHTQEVIEDFLADPESFLQAVDLPGLVARLLRRAVELPAQLVEELELLRDKLRDWAGDPNTLLNLTERVVTIIILVIVIGNLLYPDMAYGKGGHTAAAGHHAATAGRRGNAGFRGRRGYWNGTTWVGGPNYVYQRRIIQNQVVPGPKQHVPKGLQIKQYGGPNRGVAPGKPSGMLPSNNTMGSAEYFDESGRAYPARRYRFDAAFVSESSYPLATNAPAEQSVENNTVESYAVYRLGPGVDILSSGHVAMPLTDQSYLLVTNQAMHLIDQQNGSSIMPLSNDESALSMLAAEINRQHEQLEPEHPATNYLNAAREIIARVPDNGEAIIKPLADGEAEVFPSVWIAGNGKYLAFKQAGGQIIYIDGKQCYSNEGSTALTGPYPARAMAQAITYLSKIVRDVEATQSRLLKDKGELTAHLTVLANELTTYKSGDGSDVKYGSRTLLQAEAIRLTKLAINKTARQVALLDQYMEQLPAQVDLAKIALANLTGRDA
jgi:hypothetical protein